MGETRNRPIGRVRQGCCLSPLLFNLYLEEMINEYLKGCTGIKIGGRNITTIRFADDMALIAEEELLNILINQLVKGCKAFGMKIKPKYFGWELRCQNRRRKG